MTVKELKQLLNQYNEELNIYIEIESARNLLKITDVKKEQELVVIISESQLKGNFGD